MDQLFKKYNRINLPYGNGELIWGSKKISFTENWITYPHSYTHNDEILFVKSKNKNIVCDIEKEQKIHNHLFSFFSASNEKEFYRIWVIAEVIAKLKKIPILTLIKIKFESELETRNKNHIFFENYEIYYYNIDKYHLAVGKS